MTTITNSLNDLNNILEQQKSIYETNQSLHFDWLKSVIFQLDVYDQTNKKDIKVNEMDSQSIENNCKIQQQNALNSCKKQIHQAMNQEKFSKGKKQNECFKNSENLNNNQQIADKKSPPKAIPRPNGKKRLQVKSASVSLIHSPLSINNFTSKASKASKKIKTKENQSKPRKNDQKCLNRTVKFIDNDSLLSISPSSSCSSFNEDLNSTSMDDYDNQICMCQSLPSKESNLTISCKFNELTQSVSSFQEKWQEMVEEKKRSSLVPKPPIGELFNFDDTPDSYQITDSDDNDDFFLSDEDDDEIHEEDPFEIHGKMIPIWSRKENIETQLKIQQKIDPDDIFTGMPKHCVLTQIFDLRINPGSSILADGQLDESFEPIPV